MNKIKMGEFLKELRETKSLTITDLARKMEEDCFLITTNSISKWEKGKSIPDIDKLNFLAEFYNVTIDEILDGCKKEVKDYENIYYLHKSDWLDRYKGDGNEKVCDIVSKLKKEVRKTTRTIFKKYLLDKANTSEINELKFILQNYFKYANNLDEHGLYRAIRQIKKNTLLKVEEKWWEIQKLLIPLNDKNVRFRDISDEYYLYSPNKEAFLNCEDWEKDMLLAQLQVNNPVFFNRNANPNFLAEYKNRTGKDFDIEQITKNTIKFCISNGAMINDNYLGFYQTKNIKKRIIDEIERIDNEIYKPLEICVDENNNKKFLIVENNPLNRFILFYKNHVVTNVCNLEYSVEELFDIVKANEKIPEFVIDKIAKSKGLDTTKDNHLLKAEMYFELTVLEEFWTKYREYELKIDSMRIVYDSLVERLKNGEEFFDEQIKEYIGGKDFRDRRQYIVSKNNDLSFSEFKRGRLENKTKQLLDEIDELSLDEIRNKYLRKDGE